MNPLIKKQLEAVRKIKLPEYNEDTLTLFIPRQTNIEPDLVIGKCYLIEVEDYIIKPFDGFTLHDNWNNGKCPKHKYLKVEVDKIMGKMVKVNSIGFDHISNTDTTDMWEGWIPSKSFKIIREI